MALAVRTPRLDDGVLAIRDVDALRVVAPRDARGAGVRDVRTSDGVLPASLLLVVREFRRWRRERLHPAGAPAGPVGPVPGPGHEAGDLGDVVVVFGVAVLREPGCPGALRDCRMASSSVAMMVQPRVTRAFFLGDDRASRCPMRSCLAPAPSTRTRIWRRNRAGACRRAAASTSDGR